MTELDKLEEYLKEHGYVYQRINEYPESPYFINQIIVFTDETCEKRSWDAVCHPGSYGYKHGPHRGARKYHRKARLRGRLSDCGRYYQKTGE